LCKQKCRATIIATAEGAITIKPNFKRHDTFWLNIRQEPHKMQKQQKKKNTEIKKITSQVEINKF